MNKIIKFIKSPFDFFFSKLKISNNTTSKILSIAFAVIFWIYVIDQVNPEMEKWINDVPVQLQNESYLTNEGLLLMDSKEYFVDIEVSGRRNDILGFSADDMVVSADLRGYGKGLNVVPIKKRVFNENISISNISETDIKIFIDKVVEIPKPVDVSIIGQIEKGYIRDDLVIEPQKIMVKGPETYVNSVSKIKGEIDITNIKEDIGKEVPISPVDNDENVVTGVEIGESYVNVSLGIKKVKKVEIKSNVRGEVAEGYKLVSIDMIPNEATIKGYEEFLDEIDYIGTEEIDISGIYQTTEIETAIIIPYGVNLLYDIENLKVRANVEKIENKEFTFTKEDITLKNNFSDYKIEYNENVQDIKVIVSEIESVLSNITKKDIELVIDCADLEEGSNIVDLYVNIPGKEVQFETVPRKVNIIVSK